MRKSNITDFDECYIEKFYKEKVLKTLFGEGLMVLEAIDKLVNLFKSHSQYPHLYEKVLTYAYKDPSDVDCYHFVYYFLQVLGERYPDIRRVASF